MGARFSVPIPTGPGVHPASCTMGTGSFPEAKRLGRFVEHTTPSSVEVKERVDLYLHSSSVPPWQVIGQLNLYLYLFPSPILRSKITSTERPPLKSVPLPRSTNHWRYAHPSDMQNTLNAQVLPLKYHVNGSIPGRDQAFSFLPSVKTGSGAHTSSYSVGASGACPVRSRGTHKLNIQLQCRN